MPNSDTGESRISQRIDEIRDYADVILLALKEAGTLADEGNELILYVFQSRDARIKELLSNQ
jgi:hypothetical protein